MEVIISSQMYQFLMTTRVCFITLPPPIVYEAVDLGLPSGTLWASQNVGARKPSDYGLYFAWGETQGYTAEQVGTGSGKKAFSFGDYKWYLSGEDDSGNSTIKYKKYTTPSATLELEDDAAHVNMGGDWCMPTPDQIQELINTANTTTAWTTSDGVSGMTFTSTKDTSKSIFIPAASGPWNGLLEMVGENVELFSSILSTNDIERPQAVFLDSKHAIFYDGDVVRYGGCTVRGVIGEIK